MDNSFVGITQQANRILCQCPNPECGKISRFNEILVEPGKISKPTWLDDHQKNTDDFGIAANKFADEKAELKKKATDKGRLQAEQDMKNLIKNSLVPIYQQMPYDPRDITVLSHPVDFVVFDGANKVRMKEQDFVKEVVLLTKKTNNAYSQKLHKSIHDVIQNKEYEWKTAKVLDGNIEFK